MVSYNTSNMFKWFSFELIIKNKLKLNTEFNN